MSEANATKPVNPGKAALDSLKADKAAEKAKKAEEAAAKKALKDKEKADKAAAKAAAKPPKPEKPAKPAKAAPAAPAGPTVEEITANRAHAAKWSDFPKENVPLERIVVEERYRKDAGDVSELRESVRVHGMLQPILIESGTNRLIAGGRRLKAAKELGLETVPCVIADPAALGEDRLLTLMQMEIEENLHRKNPSPAETAARATQIEALLKKAGKAKKGAGATYRRDRVAAAVGSNPETLRQSRVVLAAATRDKDKYGELAKKMDKGEVSIKAAYQQLRKATAAERDVAGVPIPEKLAGAFLTVPTFDDLVKQLRNAQKTIDLLCNSEGGGQLIKSKAFRIRTVAKNGKDVEVYHHEGLKDLIGVLEDSKPVVHCPMCAEKAKALGVADKKCSACEGCLFLGASMWDGLVKAKDKAISVLEQLGKDAPVIKPVPVVPPAAEPKTLLDAAPEATPTTTTEPAAADPAFKGQF